MRPLYALEDSYLNWRLHHETPEIIPPTALAAITRAYAKIITDVNAVNLQDLQRPAASAGGN